MTSAADREGENCRVKTQQGEVRQVLNLSRGEEDGDDVVGVGEEEEGRRCECGKTLLRKPASSAATATATSKQGRRRRRKKPPDDGGERQDLFNDTSGAAATNAATNAVSIPKIRVIVAKNAGHEEEEDSTRELSSTNSTVGAVDEGIYDGNSSSIDSSIFGNKSSSCSSSRKSSRIDTNSSREKTGRRRPSYLPTGDAISLMIIEGCELCQESILMKTDFSHINV